LVRFFCFSEGVWAGRLWTRSSRGNPIRYKSSAEIDVMRSLKRALDPKNILNPGKLLPD
jgi:FAD/FMN-containing dehydrogenase